jgi:LCP family protein required for cell wall assembly
MTSQAWLLLAEHGPLPARVLATLLSATVLLATGVGWATVGSIDRGLNSTDVLSPAGANDKPGGDGATDILLVGDDSRTDAQGAPLPQEVLQALRTEQSQGTNTDTIILVRIPDNGSAAHAISIPRDTDVALPDGNGSDKINSVYGTFETRAARQLRGTGVTDAAQIERDSAQAGRRALVTTVEHLTGLRIDHYAEVNLYGFYLLTQAIGGVEVCLNAPAKDSFSGTDLPAGRQTLSGGDALSFVRQRHGLPRGDLDRIVRQQVFMASAVRKVLSAGTLTDPTRLSALSAAARSSVVLDKNWDILGFAQQMHGLAAGAVDFVTIPVADVAAHDDRGQSIIKVDPAQVRQFVAHLADPSTASPPGPAGPAPPSAAPAGPAVQAHTVDVLNGTDVAGLAGQVSAKLIAAGFTAGKTGNIPLRQVTLIKVPPRGNPIGEQISTLLGGGIPILVEPELTGNQVEVLVGADYLNRTGSRTTAPALFKQDGAGAAPRLDGAAAARQPPPINAAGVHCIN